MRCKKILPLPWKCAADLGNIPMEILDKIRIDFFSKPMLAAYKAIAEA